MRIKGVHLDIVILSKSKHNSYIRNWLQNALKYQNMLNYSNTTQSQSIVLILLSFILFLSVSVPLCLSFPLLQYKRSFFTDAVGSYDENPL